MTTENTFVVSEEEAKKLDANNPIVNNTLETLKTYMSTASKIYNLFCNSNMSSKDHDVEKWKKFEHDMVKMIYEAVDYKNAPDVVCTITALINAFGLSLATVASLEYQVNDLKAKLSEKTNG